MELSFEDFIKKFQAEIGGDIKNHLLKENIKQRVFSISSMYPNRFYINEPQHEVLDFANNTIIPKEDNDFHVFFAHRLRRIDNFSTEEFLNYHLLNTFKAKKEDFEKFLILTLREYKFLFDNSSNYGTILDFIKTIHSATPSELIKKIGGYGFEELFLIDKIFHDNFPAYKIIESILIEEDYLSELNGKLKWNKQRQPFTKIENFTIIILLLKEYVFFNKSVFNKSIGIYKNAFEKRYQIKVSTQFQPHIRKRIEERIENHKLMFQFIQTPSRVLENAREISKNL